MTFVTDFNEDELTRAKKRDIRLARRNLIESFQLDDDTDSTDVEPEFRADRGHIFAGDNRCQRCDTDYLDAIGLEIDCDNSDDVFVYSVG